MAVKRLVCVLVMAGRCTERSGSFGKLEAIQRMENRAGDSDAETRTGVQTQQRE